MATKRKKRATGRIKNLAAKRVSPKRAKDVKGGDIPITKDTDTASKKLF